MKLGRNIRLRREEMNMTQEELAEKMNVSFQAVSAWERDVYLPETENLFRLSEILRTTADALADEQRTQFQYQKTVFDPERMKTYIKTTARAHGMTDTLKAMDFASEKHAGMTRKNSDIPYIYHPMTVVCHALAMGLYEDDITAACLLHDTVEDCGVRPEELPVNKRVQNLVVLLTKNRKPMESREQAIQRYYEAIQSDPAACLVKCIDRCNNLTTMSWGFDRSGKLHYIEETEQYYPTLLRIIKKEPRFFSAAWLLKYQIESMLDIYKHLMEQR